MRRIACIVALLALVGTIAPPLWFLFGSGSGEQLGNVKTYMLIATVVWFVAATLWLWKDDEPDHAVPTVDDDEAAVI